VQKQNVLPSANSNVDAAGSPSPSPAQSGKRKIKPLSFGGLLARVQQRALPGGAMAAPSSTAAADSGSGESPPEERTPARKRPLAEIMNDSQKNQMAFSGKKLGRPSKSLRVETESKPSDATVTGSTFLSLATACNADDDDVANTLAECLREIAGHSDNRQDALTAAMAMLAPSKVIAGKMLGTALSEAFGSPVPSLRAEALAAMALDGRHRHTGVQLSSPLTIRDVSDALTVAGGTPDDPNVAVKCLTRLFLRTQKGVEPFYLVRALQGQLTSNADVVHSAVAKAMAPVTMQ